MLIVWILRRSIGNGRYSKVQEGGLVGLLFCFGLVPPLPYLPEFLGYEIPLIELESGNTLIDERRVRLISCLIISFGSTNSKCFFRDIQVVPRHKHML